MPTLGQTGDNSGSSASNAAKTSVSKVTAVSSGTLDSGATRIWVDANTATTKMCVYSDSSGAPGTKLAESAEVVLSNTTEQEIAYSFLGANRIPIVSGTDYWIGPAWPLPASSTITISRQATTAGRRETASYAPSTFGSPTSLTGPIDTYITYLTPTGNTGGFFEFF